MILRNKLYELLEYHLAPAWRHCGHLFQLRSVLCDHASHNIKDRWQKRVHGIPLICKVGRHHIPQQSDIARDKFRLMCAERNTWAVNEWHSLTEELVDVDSEPLDKLLGHCDSYIMHILNRTVRHDLGYSHDVAGHAQEHRVVLHFKFIEINSNADISLDTEKCKISVKAARILQSLKFLVVSSIKNTEIITDSSPLWTREMLLETADADVVKCDIFHSVLF